MVISQWPILLAAILLCLIAAALSMIETSLRLLSVSRAETLAEQGRRGASRLTSILSDPAPAMSAVAFARVLSEVGTLSLVAGLVFEHVDGWAGQMLWLIVIMVSVSFIVWGIGPQTLAHQHSESIACSTTLLVRILSTLIWPISQLLIWIGNALTPGRGYTDGPYGEEAQKIAEASEGEREMINSVFELGDTLVREVMVPRTDVVFIEQSKTIRQALSLGLRSGFSRIPVVENGIDDVVGLAYVKDLAKRVYDCPEAGMKEDVASLMRQASFVPDSKPVDDLMRQMQKTRQHMVIVIDEFGGTAGIATIEDVVEEIVGEITDEYDSDPDLAQQLDDSSWRISARMPVDEMGDLFGADLDDEDVETVGGLLAKELNMVPIKGSQIIWHGLEITAETATSRRHQIDTVIVRKLDADFDDKDVRDENG